MLLFDTYSAYEARQCYLQNILRVIVKSDCWVITKNGKIQSYNWYTKYENKNKPSNVELKLQM